jgi:hypothetical protein
LLSSYWDQKAGNAIRKPIPSTNLSSFYDMQPLGFNTDSSPPALLVP